MKEGESEEKKRGERQAGRQWERVKRKTDREKEKERMGRESKVIA